MVVLGDTRALTPDRVPTPWSILRLVAPLTDHVRLLLCPVVMLAGVAVKLAIVGFCPLTVMDTVAVDEPAALLAVNVYVVEVVGVTPTVVPVTAPMVGLIVRLVAPVTDQASTLLAPAFRVLGVAVKLLIVGLAAFTVISKVEVTLPAGLDAVRV